VKAIRLPADEQAGGVEATKDAPPGSAPLGSPDPSAILPATYTDAFTRGLLRLAERRPEIVALTAAMPGPTGLLPFQARFPERFFDVGIAEQHEVTAAAGMAMGGLRPVVAVYSTFFCRAFDQANLDVGLHGLPVVFVLDRAGITGDNGPSHHGLLDLALTLSIPGMTVFAPSSAEEVEVMLETALDLPGPAAIRFSKTPPDRVRPGEVGHGLTARRLRDGTGSVCLLGVGKLVAACEAAAAELAAEGIDATVWDVRVVSPPDPAMLADAARHGLVVTAEDGARMGGAGMFLADALSQATIKIGAARPPVTVLGIPRTYVPQGEVDDILTGFGLDGPGIASSVRQALCAHQHAADGIATASLAES
jgi:1-deoxy-D-xylulose-5-phosphate synthase